MREVHGQRYDQFHRAASLGTQHAFLDATDVVRLRRCRMCKAEAESILEPRGVSRYRGPQAGCGWDSWDRYRGHETLRGGGGELRCFVGFQTLEIGDAN